MQEPINTGDIVRAEPGRIHIDIEATFERIVTVLGTGPGAELQRLLDHPRPGVWQFAHDPGDLPTEAELALDTGLPPAHLHSVGRGDDSVKGLALARFGVTYTNLTTGGKTYADRHRVIEALSIIEPVGITAVDYPQYVALCLGRIESATPGLAQLIETYQIPTGNYLIASLGGWGSRQHWGSCRIKRVPDIEALGAIPGSRIDHVRATCDQCRSNWTAEHGSLAFQPTAPNTNVKAWDYTEATGHDQNRVDCPRTGCGGRVAFTN